MRILASLFLLAIMGSVRAEARPVSYPDGWTLILHNDVIGNSLLAHYTLDTQHSVGLRLRYDRQRDFSFVGAQLNRLLKRWNNPDSQANLYGRIAIGSAFDDHSRADTRARRADDEAIFLGLSGDWENRRYFVSASAEYWDNGRFGDFATYHGRLGFAPYVANTGALHTWFMIEGHHRPQNRDKLSSTAIIRFFKGPRLLEIGVDDRGEPLLNYIHRF